MKGLAHALRLPAAVWPDLARAIMELALARRTIDRLPIRDMLPARRHGAPSDESPEPLSPDAVRLVQRVAFAVPRMARYLPWRTDCLVQALAAQRWLRVWGIPCRLVLGVGTRPGTRQLADGSGIGAHAWLLVQDICVIGGDVSDYVPFDS